MLSESLVTTALSILRFRMVELASIYGG